MRSEHVSSGIQRGGGGGNRHITWGVEINELASICGQTIFKIIPDSEKIMPTSIMLKQLILLMIMFYLDFFYTLFVDSFWKCAWP